MNAKNRSTLDLNRLEAREVPAVAASLSAAGVLTLTGDGAADRVLVSTVGNQVQAQFTNAAGSPTTLSVDAAAVKGLVLNGGGGNDYLANTTGVFAALNGGTGDDYLQGGAGNDVMNGGAGNDTLIDNTGGTNTFIGGDGDDQMSSTVAGATMDGGAGNDLLYDIIGGSKFTGGAGVDNVIVKAGDALTDLDPTNNTNNDLVTVFGQTTAPTAVINRILYINGTSGNDTITIDDAGPNLKVTINGQSSYFGRASIKGIGVLGNDGDDKIDNNSDDNNASRAVFMVAYGGNGNDDLRGSAGFDFLKGGAGNDYVSARSGGNDFIGGDAGADTLVSDNGAGVDSGRDTIYADPTDTVSAEARDKVVGTFLPNWFGTP